MEPTGILKIVDYIATGIEIMGVAVIAFAFIHALLRGVMRFGKGRPDAFDSLKIYIGKAIQLGLEFLVAADIIMTVTMEPTIKGMLSLGLLILVRTILSWSITVEIEGCWPWQVAKLRKG